MMNEAQEKNLLKIKALVTTWTDEKYRAGDSEHQGDLVDMSVKTLLMNSIQENIDSLAYQITAWCKL